MKFSTATVLLASCLWLIIQAARTEDIPSPSHQICSLNYPKHYPNGIRWSLMAHAKDSNSALHITFTHFDLEGSAKCTRDYLDVYDGGNGEDIDRHLGRFCGSTIPADITSSESSALFILNTNANVSASGFCITYYSTQKNSTEYKQQLIVICSVYATMTLLTILGFLKYKIFYTKRNKDNISVSSVCKMYKSDVPISPPPPYSSQTEPSCNRHPPQYEAEHVCKIYESDVTTAPPPPYSPQTEPSCNGRPPQYQIEHI
ncbi:cubilin-like [Haliotis rubra]|uniref:cubilin-like n=1 Tax=Haliotis rubra TaxID=36100 RepID=UPI001EE572DF|nr:cubilin-like [Haliotis rubra]